MTFVRVLLSITNFQFSPFLSNLFPALSAAFGMQLFFGIPSIFFHTEMFYDFSGGWTFLLTLASSLILPALRRGDELNFSVAGALESWDWRQLALTGAVAVYAIRLSGYLFLRVLKKGHDSRFDLTKHKPRRFFFFWMVQAIWVSLMTMPVIAIDSIHPAAFKSGMGVPEFLLTDIVGLGLFFSGFLIETVADYQKAVWLFQKQDKVHDEQFITRGLWGRSRYPNYFGDITLWTGIAVVAAGVLSQGPVKASLGWYGIAGQLKAVLIPAIAPAFITWGLLKATGVPLSEAKYDKLYGDRKDYQKWRYNTPLLVPKVF